MIRGSYFHLTLIQGIWQSRQLLFVCSVHCLRAQIADVV